MAESHNDFARTELDEGDYYTARHEISVAEKNAQAAVEKSPRDRCVPPDAPPPVRKPSPVDTDGDGILDNVDDCPRKPEDFDGFEDKDGCPEDDNDSDGILDKDDGCPLQPEDKDGFEDTDGCPDPDNDKDGLADKVDQCPEEPEDADGHDDDDGCPDCDDDGDGVPECPEPIDKCPNKPAKTPDGCPAYKLVVVTQNKIEIKQTIYFDTRKATIKRVSYPLLDEVAQALFDNPTIQIRIEGHTDSQGKDAFNLKLSTNRAASVRNYLIAKGVEESRMTSEGFGETMPIADNRTKEGRSQNRRVEFVITSR
jgi:outer membrane protein OmpA-like peptidoglycan-associated protein